MNSLDDKVIIRKSHLAALCAMLNPLNQEQDRVASESIRVLDQDLTGWAAVPVEETRQMMDAARQYKNLLTPWGRAYRAMLNASPALFETKEKQNEQA